MADMYNFNKKYNAMQLNLWKSQVDDQDKQAIETYLKYQKAKGLSLARITKVGTHLTILANRLGKLFDKATEDDIKNLINHYEYGEYSFWTKHDIKVILKQYYAWLNKGQYPAKVSWICTTIPLRDKRVAANQSQLLTTEEVTKLIDTADHPRNKALIALLAESGARIGEIGNLTIGQVNIDPNGVVLNLQGKTGCRRIRIVSATPHLITWLNCHPASHCRLHVIRKHRKDRSEIWGN